jgi:hypothetical protein
VQVTLTHPFQMAQFELTQREWVELGLPNPSGLIPDGTGGCAESSCAVGNVTRLEAFEFANRYSKTKVCRLLRALPMRGGSGAWNAL